MKTLTKFIKEGNNISISQFIREALSKELQAEKNRLYKRFNGKNPLEFWKYLCNEKTEDIIRRFNNYFERLKDYYESAKEKNNSLSFDKYVEEADWVIGGEVFKTRKDYINFLTKFEKEKDKKAFLLSDEVINKLNLSRESGLNSFQNILSEYDYNNLVEFIEEINDTWCVHFIMSGKETAPGFVANGNPDGIDEYVDIIKNGFKIGTPYPDTSKFKDSELGQVYASLGKEKVENGINFAYELDYAKYNFKEMTDLGGRLITKSHYGFLGLVFKTEGIVVYHNQDREYQVLFNGKSAKGITPIIADYTQNLWGIIKNISRDNNGIIYEFEKQFKSWEELMDYFKSNKNTPLKNYISPDFKTRDQLKKNEKDAQDNELSKLLDIVKEKFPEAYVKGDFVWVEYPEYDIKLRFMLKDKELRLAQIIKDIPKFIEDNEDYNKVLTKAEKLVQRIIKKNK